MAEPQNLRRLLIARAAIEHVPGAECLRAAIDHWLEHGGTLDEALGIVGEPGSRSIRTQWLQLCRDRALRDAWRLCNRDWSLLRESIDRFEGRLWPELADEPTLSSRHSELTRALHAAFRCGLGVPRSTKRLGEAVARAVDADASSPADVHESLR